MVLAFFVNESVEKNVVDLLPKRIEYNRMSKCNLHKIRHKMLN